MNLKQASARYTREIETKSKEVGALLEKLTEAQSFLAQDSLTREAGEWSLMLFELLESIKYLEIDIMELHTDSATSAKPALLQAVGICLVME
jgi:hypothetical protein